MKMIFRRVSVRGVASFSLTVVTVGVFAACGPMAPPAPAISGEDAWSRPSAVVAAGSEDMNGAADAVGGQGATGAVFMTLKNDGRRPDTLIAAHADGIAEAVELHRTTVDDGVMKMQPVESGIEIPAQSEVVLKPGDYHMMLLGLKRDLKVGDTFTITLSFELSDPLELSVEVREP